ncbi:phosphoribosylglycinamide formyltransferase [Petroclostridium sp. X23]|uniref:phosphoribosylglycinamide formyltransferase n=1 Tax=Petroclostridium sp. X23 TaxID=3045146 RepID=UPI0024ADF1C1|nr:phosphoribosylglycinamide formyltransferase [Petroclostridium sp. X23]WHH58187.1 phosphoribosylglycinamide formyltransferase [Petroclostridium sp. X23]
MLNIGVLVSGGGTNLQAIIDAIEEGTIRNGRIVTVVSNREGGYALERARKHDISYAVIPRKGFDSKEAYDQALLEHMQQKKVDIIVMAGFLSIIGEKLIAAYRNKIINVHPSLIPSFCGDGYYGMKVHEKALEYGVKVTGATVHFVNEVVDGGAIILQKAVEVRQDDTPEILQKRVMEEAEWKILPEAVNLLCEGKIRVEGRHVVIS